MVKVGDPKDNTPGCTQEACDFRGLSPALPLEEIVNKYGHAGVVLESL